MILNQSTRTVMLLWDYEVNSGIDPLSGKTVSLIKSTKTVISTKRVMPVSTTHFYLIQT